MSSAYLFTYVRYLLEEHINRMLEQEGLQLRKYFSDTNGSYGIQIGHWIFKSSILGLTSA